jgi:hypothetical protein
MLFCIIEFGAELMTVVMSFVAPWLVHLHTRRTAASRRGSVWKTAPKRASLGFAPSTTHSHLTPAITSLPYDVTGQALHLSTPSEAPRPNSFFVHKNHASRAQGKLSLWCCCFHGPVEHTGAVPALYVYNLPQGGRCRWIDQPRSACGDASNHQGKRRHLV